MIGSIFVLSLLLMYIGYKHEVQQGKRMEVNYWSLWKWALAFWMITMGSYFVESYTDHIDQNTIECVWRTNL